MIALAPQINFNDSLVGLHLRQAALRQIANYFDRQDCPTLVGGNLRGVYKETPVTTDFVVSEVPPLGHW